MKIRDVRRYETQMKENGYQKILMKLSGDYDGDPNVFTNVMEEVKEAETSTAKEWQRQMMKAITVLPTQEQRKAENEGVTEDDVNEIKNDISAFRSR